MKNLSIIRYFFIWLLLITIVCFLGQIFFDFFSGIIGKYTSNHMSFYICILAIIGLIFYLYRKTRFNTLMLAIVSLFIGKILMTVGLFFWSLVGVNSDFADRFVGINFGTEDDTEEGIFLDSYSKVILSKKDNLTGNIAMVQKEISARYNDEMSTNTDIGYSVEGFIFWQSAYSKGYAPDYLKEENKINLVLFTLSGFIYLVELIVKSFFSSIPLWVLLIVIIQFVKRRSKFIDVETFNFLNKNDF